MKKALKIFGFIILTIIILLVVAPFVFESQLKDLVKKTLNDNLNAQVDFEDIDLSMFRSFPQATLVIEDLSIINNEPFKGDTLAIGEEVTLEMSVKELFKSSDEPKKIDQLTLNNAFINIKVDSLGTANYDIAVEDTTTTGSESTPFSLDLKHYEINNSRVKYDDRNSKVSLEVKNLNHEGTGDFSLDQSELDTYSEALVSLDYDGVNYLNQNEISLDAVFQMDLENMKYTFLENEARVNQLPLTFDGYVQVNDEDTEMDITFKTPSSDFKNFLAVIPEIYAKNIENVETKGDFVVNGRIFGKTDDTYIPKMDIKIASDNASFKYPDLPKSVQDISLDMEILNDSGLAEETYININNATFRIDQDRFTANGNINNITENMLVDLALKGTVNLANISKAYPLEMEQDLNGILTADIKTNFDMNSIEKEQYQNVKSSGKASIRDFKYSSPEIPNEVKIANADMSFNQGNVNVPNLKMTTGKTDISASGTLQNLMGFLFTDQQLKGNFQVQSNTFSVNDFMVAETEEITTTDEDGKDKTVAKTTGKEAVKVPSFLDMELRFNANTVLYDDLELKNAKGILVIRDETARLQDISTNIFNGSIGLNGLVSTKNATPVFEMDLNLNSLDIASSFDGLDLMQGLAPLAKAIEGKLQSTMSLKGNLNEDLTPQLTSLAGNALAELLTAEINPEKAELLSKLDSQLKFINFKDIDLSKIKTNLTFTNGMVQIAPMNFNIKGIDFQVSGSHGFDMNMNYDLKLDVPAKYLGSEVSSTLGKLSGETIENTTVELPIGITGSFQSPKINLNMQQAVNSLTQKVVAQQKKNLENKAVDAINDILQGKRDPNKPFNKNDTTAVNSQNADSTATKAPVTKRDSINQSQQKQVQDAAKNILGGILKNSKKKTDTTSNN
ncbi:AsmA-like C-terminal region-containing protein [Christiangramia sp. SM2212]|uniref:AsmA-like C-terminal region-containing protein n=1 Tax=Christiangramia sediminicola TaxID=3073267 RepID=A0ABU1EM22_9FLAO|nr:AsmA-like C-terminal region-containing protein [Christiangramia sp. SM2212]MDR5589441.1 AsmA-like C-terminal region-containing protein [Christiangramia sp. SM2212]